MFLRASKILFASNFVRFQFCLHLMSNMEKYFTTGKQNYSGRRGDSSVVPLMENG